MSDEYIYVENAVVSSCCGKPTGECTCQQHETHNLSKVLENLKARFMANPSLFLQDLNREDLAILAVEVAERTNTSVEEFYASNPAVKRHLIRKVFGIQDELYEPPAPDYPIGNSQRLSGKLAPPEYDFGPVSTEPVTETDDVPDALLQRVSSSDPVVVNTAPTNAILTGKLGLPDWEY